MSDIQIKGPSLNYLKEFIDEKYPGKYQEWFDALPAEAKIIFGDMILSTNWYDLNDSHVEGIKTLGKIFFAGDEFKAAYEMGKFGGVKALTGIYKIFIKIPSLDFIVKKVSTIAATYYSEGIKISITNRTERKLTLSVYGFEVGQELMMPNIAGWIDNLGSGLN
ncbi:MAG: hypothetical protein JXL97_11240 [Bacteroidales bacterium]|nr:hypothetical protein [Bacteroidales bacterium]